jgi:IMP dehydrogenase/GMP reductase
MHGHGDKPYLCSYQGCERSVHGNGFPRHWNLKDHMRRVHSDPGDSVDPMATGQASTSGSAPSTKGKKRKSKDGVDSSSSRKVPTTKSKAKAERTGPSSDEPATYMDEDEWLEHKKALLDIAQGLKPDDANAQQSIKDALNRLSHLSKITERLGGRPVHKRHSG